jgi:hypothetical protein
MMAGATFNISLPGFTRLNIIQINSTHEYDSNNVIRKIVGIEGTYEESGGTIGDTNLLFPYNNVAWDTSSSELTLTLADQGDNEDLEQGTEVTVIIPDTYGLVLPEALSINDESLTISAKGSHTAPSTRIHLSPEATSLKQTAKVRLTDQTAGNVGTAVVSFTVPTGLVIPNGGKIEVQFPTHMNGYMNNIVEIIKGGILTPEQVSVSGTPKKLTITIRDNETIDASTEVEFRIPNVTMPPAGEFETLLPCLHR